MRVASKNIDLKKVQAMFNHPRSWDLCWAMDIKTKESVIFEVKNMDLFYGRQLTNQKIDLKPGMLVKFSVNWMSREFMDESFWMEVEKIVDGVDGELEIYGMCVNNTERVCYGSPLGPIRIRNILEVKE